MISNSLAKKTKLVIGLMSGTSLDGVDAVLVKLSGNGLLTKYEQLGFITLPYSKVEIEALLNLAKGNVGGSEELLKMNVFLGKKFTKAALKVCSEVLISPEEIDLIGSSGHTFYHLPNETSYLGEKVSGTFQLGEASYLNEAFNCPVVSDFRVRDMASGGQGAPLVPYTEYLLFRSNTKTLALQNIGGIGNITILPKACNKEDVIAFDTGPGNMVIDSLVRFYSNNEKSYDKNGEIANRGKLNEALLEQLLDDDYLRKPIPKSTGREKYNKNYIAEIINYAQNNNISKEDVIFTATYFTSKTIEIGLKNNCKVLPETLIVGGGGSHNSTLINILREMLSSVKVVTNEDIGLNSDSKEAVAFAVLANETICGNCNNLISVTGASHPVIMGKVSF